MHSAHQDYDWDYLVLTASNDAQAQAYETQLQLRRRAGMLPRVRRILACADPGGQRIGSGGATILALNKILALEAGSGAEAESFLKRLRILILHAGGDSRRLPAYAPFGKIFAPLPGGGDEPMPPALFDRLAPLFLNLPPGVPGQGQIVVAAGDALMRWNTPGLTFQDRGITVLGSEANPLEASRHGVICVARDGSAALYLQKPSLEEQQRAGAVRPNGTSVLDIGVMSMDGCAAAAMLEVFCPRHPHSPEDLAAQASLWAAQGGLDLYREICCALGAQASLEHYIRTARSSGSGWPEPELARIFPALHGIPFRATVLRRCRFYHFGTTRQLLESGLSLVEAENGSRPGGDLILVNNVIAGQGCIRGRRAWVEGCRIQAPLELGGNNVVTGVDVDAPLTLASGACLDVQLGAGRSGGKRWFFRCYGFDDDFKGAVTGGATFCGIPLLEWIAAAGLTPDDVWEASRPAGERTLWNARVFPCGPDAGSFGRWLWMYDPARAGEEERREYLHAERYSAAEIARLADLEAFSRRRAENWARLTSGRLRPRDS